MAISSAIYIRYVKICADIDMVMGAYVISAVVKCGEKRWKKFRYVTLFRVANT